MAIYSYYPDLGRSLTSFGNASQERAGDTVTLSVSSYAYSLPKGRFGWQGSQWTTYVLPEPVGVGRWGEPLFDLTGCGTCPIDGSRQDEATREAAERRELARLLGRDDPAAYGQGEGHRREFPATEA